MFLIKKVLLLAMILCYLNAPAQQLYITLNPLNCVNCSIGLYALLKEPGIPDICVTLKESCRENAADLEETFEFSRFPKIRLFYSDSLYQALSRESFESEIIISDDTHRETFRAMLKRFNIQTIRNIFSPE